MVCAFLLTLFLVKSLMKGDAEASLIYGAYTALIYAAPVLGGRMADKYLGYRYAILLGAVMMAIGEFFMVGAGLERYGYAIRNGCADCRQRILQSQHLHHCRKTL